jgi:flagellar basal-body rod protein FlgB
MIRDVLFGKDGNLELAKRALDAGTLRQRVIASNLANAETPGYRSQEVAFEELLTQEQQSLDLHATQPGHLKSGPTAPVPQPLVRPRGGEADASGVNDVSVEREMTELTENTIHFQAMSQLLANQYKAVRDAIRPGA